VLAEIVRAAVAEHLDRPARSCWLLIRGDLERCLVVAPGFERG
jgi:hypothetical protein